MVPVIRTGGSHYHAVNYNEQKVRTGNAVCLDAVSFPKDFSDLNIQQLILTFKKFSARNHKSKCNNVHISINFHPREQITDELLKKIAEVYMDKIGFGDQPYLLYRHFDAAHPHVHIVTTTIRLDGSRIDLRNIVKSESESARTYIENLFGLIKAKEHLGPADADKANHAQTVRYGQMETYLSMAQVINRVVPHYKYASLAELNLVLRQYNVVADCGSPGSFLFKVGGLIYRIIDQQGHRVGVPVRASAFPTKPTLKNLQKSFKIAEAERAPYALRVKNLIDLTFLQQPAVTIDKLKGALELYGINLVIQRDAAGLMDDLNYIDHVTKCVFSGKALGEAYHVTGLLRRCSLTDGDQRSIPGKTTTEQEFNRDVSVEIVSKALEEFQPLRDSQDLLPAEPRRSRRKKRKYHH
ncbi:MAG: relaxase/mobilization nuclease domain-containing protein [Sphingobacteriales bacterium]